MEINHNEAAAYEASGNHQKSKRSSIPLKEERLEAGIQELIAGFPERPKMSSFSLKFQDAAIEDKYYQSNE